ncbi:MAG: hypothetical protein ACI4AM_01780 [Muribaculaceae bacterium]
MKTIESLTLNELEQLAQAYIDCRLTRLEEKELELVLASSPLSSPTINEAREQMVLTSLMAESHSRRRLLKRRFIRFGSIAACLAALIIGGMMLIAPTEPQVSYYVCINGQELHGEAAKRYALETEQRMEQCRQELLNQALAIEKENERMLNH